MKTDIIPHHPLFTYKFYEELDRVYNCFTNFRILTEVTLAGYIKNFQLSQAITLDKDGLEFSYIWKDKYNIKMITEKTIKNLYFRGFTHRTLSIKEVNSLCSFIYKFFWNSCEQYTLFIFEVELEDKNMIPLLLKTFTLEDKVKICRKLENFIKSTTKDLVQYESIVLNHPILKVWKYISNFQNLSRFGLYDENCVFVLQGSLTMIGSVILIYESAKKDKLYRILYVKNILMSDERIKFVFESKRINTEPLQVVKIMIEFLPENSCLLIIKNIFQDYSPCKFICDLAKKKRHALKFIKNQLDDM